MWVGRRTLRAANEALRSENDELRLRLAEASEALEAIRTGQVESLVVEGPEGPRIFSLEGSEHAYRVLVEAMNEGAATLNESRVILYCNRKFTELLGAPLERTMGSSIHDHLSPGSRSRFEALLHRAQDLDVREEMALRAFDGEEIPVYLSVSLMAEADRRSYCLVATDLREQKLKEALERGLSEELRLQAAIANHLSEGIYLVRASDSTIVYANLRFDAIFGGLPGATIGRPIAFTQDPDRFFPEVLPEEIRDALEKLGTWEGDIQARRTDGAPLWCHLSMSRFEHPRFATVFIGVLSDISERKRLEFQRARAFDEREILLKEIHHRVKNNLQVISSLFYLQGQRTKNEGLRALLDESRTRIQSICLIHEKLYESNHFADIDFGDYLESLIQALTAVYGAETQQVAVTIDAHRISLDIDHAIPCALIVNELVSNAMKHGFSGGRRGEISVSLRRLDSEHLELVVADTGRGLPEDLDFRATTTLGLQLVCSLTQQLQGTIALSREGGARFTILFRAPAPEPSPPA